MACSKYSIHFFIYLTIIILASGCAQQSPSHRVINETPAVIGPIYSERAPNTQTTISIKKPETQTEIKQHVSIWDRLLSLYAFPEIDNERVQKQLNLYLQHPEFLTRIQQRAEPYLYFILEEIEAKKIPGELALLPAIESAFKPKAYSRSKAAGLWQFIPSTGRFFGLKQDWWYDGRHDVVTSTRAATLYLKQLSEEFDGDWSLALASYNAGKGNIRKAIRHNTQQNLDTDYWSLNLRRETMNYVPRLLAITKIFANPEKYNLRLQDIPNKPYFEIVKIKSQLDLSTAAEIAQTPIDDFLKLNPGFNRWSTPPNSLQHLLIPVDKTDDFKTRLSQLTEKQRMQWTRHKINPGENLSVIAKRHHTTIAAIKHSNQLTSNHIRAGKYLKIPVSHKVHKTPLLAETKASQIYIVKKGDTFWDIARLFSVTSKELAHWNKLSLNATLQPGQRLLIKKQGKVTVASSTFNPFQNYTVKKGDSLSMISRKFKVSIADLRKWNNDTADTYLQPGQKLKLIIDSYRPAT